MNDLSLRLGARLSGLAGGLLRRFPESLAVAALATLLALAAVNGAIAASWQEAALSAGFWCAAAGPFLAGLRLLAEGRGWPVAWHAAAGLAGALLLAAWAWAQHGLSIEHWFAGFHFLLPAASLLWALVLAPGLAAGPAPSLAPSLAPNLAPGAPAGPAPSAGEAGFWHGVRRALIALAAAALTVLILAAGLSAAILGLQLLLDLEVPDAVQADLWVVAGLLLLPCGWLALLPPGRAPAQAAMSPALAIAIDLVLVPLALVYLAILYAYLVLAVLNWSLPESTTAGLVAAYAAAGTAFWLVAAAPDRPGGPHVRLFRRLFFPALLPPLAMLALALEIRIADYGVTEPRYLLSLLALWMLGAALAQLLPRRRFARARLAAIPAMLCLLLVLASVGPWGARAVSQASQLDQLQAELTAAGLLRAGKVARPETAPPFAMRQRISNILDYLAGTGTMAGLQDWLPPDRPLPPDAGAEEAARVLGLAYVSPYSAADEPRHVSLWGADLLPMSIAGYDSLMPFDLHAPEGGPPGSEVLLLGGRRYRLFITAEPAGLELTDSEGRSIRFALDGVIGGLDRSGGDAQEAHIAEGGDRGLRARLVVRQLSGLVAAQGPVLRQASGFLLLAPAPPD
ncbi:MAG: DUF4153 domain-containing protein [Sneathiellaceae bacterium]